MRRMRMLRGYMPANSRVGDLGAAHRLKTNKEQLDLREKIGTTFYVSQGAKPLFK